MIAVIAALRTEVKFIRDDRLRVVVGGIGEDAAREAAERICRDKPPLVVSAGFCGAIDASLRTGDLVAGGTVREGARFAPDERAVAAVPDARRGDTLWVPRVTRDLGPRPGVLAVDMESAVVAEVAATHRVPFLALRVVLDTPAEPLASTYEWSLVLQPWKWPGVLKDARRANTAARALARGLSTLADRLLQG